MGLWFYWKTGRKNLCSWRNCINNFIPGLKTKKIAHDAHREVAFLKNRTSFYIVAGLISLAIIGIISQLVNNPAGFFRSIAIMVLIVAVIFFLINRFSKAGPQKYEQRAFNKAAKQSKKRFQHKESHTSGKRTPIGSLSAARKKKKDASHLTVIEGRKGKKKNRASF
jgi:hypothetical protein